MDLTSLSKILIPMAEKLDTSYVAAVVITGMSVVFLGLVILIFFVWAFGKLFTIKSKKPAEPPKTEPVKVSPAPVSVAADDNEDEIVAVISAAIAAMGQADGKTYKIKSVKAVKNRPSRNAWSLAGLQNNTNPF